MKDQKVIAGCSTLVLLAVGFTLKLMHYPGAGVLFTLGTASMLFWFLPVLVSKIENKLMAFATYISFALYGLGVYLKFMHYIGAGVSLIAGTLLLVSFFTPLFLKHNLKPSKA